MPLLLCSMRFALVLHRGDVLALGLFAACVLELKVPQTAVEQNVEHFPKLLGPGFRK